MNMQQLNEERLWEYIDGTLSAEDSSVIAELIRTQAEWNAKYKELLEVHQLMQSSELEEPSMRFTKNVMDEISRIHIAPATKSYINNNIIRGLTFFFVSMAIGFLVYGFGQVNWKESGDTKLPIDLGGVDYSVFFNNTYVNAFMMVNVILGLFLLDRYLAHKRKKYMEEA